MKRIEIFKLTEIDDATSEPLFFTLIGLRNYILNEAYDVWENNEEEPIRTKEQIKESRTNLFDYLNVKGFYVESVCDVSESDFENY